MAEHDHAQFTTAIVQIECRADGGVVVCGNASDEFMLPMGGDYNMTVRALLEAGFVRIDGVGEAIAAKLREGGS